MIVETINENRIWKVGCRQNTAWHKEIDQVSITASIENKVHLDLFFSRGMTRIHASTHSRAWRINQRSRKLKTSSVSFKILNSTRRGRIRKKD